ncbi:hypothetical protein DM02DRAFT_573723 [Periconia macrospinosa]|uniref:Zn(2)-C6 fungal-type domain-containing protein n=1 Tax=Periconia macrospinosa TaxID=97972 RepID=A0A2V1D700_9PLEO|nr:hypothetical protein DM02DRAFT_573723 [Periconia macrospinosa]
MSQNRYGEALEFLSAKPAVFGIVRSSLIGQSLSQVSPMTSDHETDRETSDISGHVDSAVDVHGSLEGARLSKVVCLLCRQRKIRCNRRLPKCLNCSKADVDCKYTVVKEKPGLRAGYVSKLEARLGKLEHEVRLLKACQPGFLQSVEINDVPNSSPSNRSSHDTSPISPRTGAEGAPYLTTEFDPLSAVVLEELCTEWFEKYHSWFPILHQPSLLEVLQASPVLSSTEHYIVLKAIVAVTIINTYQSESLTEEQRGRLSSDLRSQVVMQAISHLSLQSLQAVLIIALRDYGKGMLTEFWNLIALAKRMGTQLGLRDLVANHCDNYNQLSTIPPRMLPLPVSLVNREEKIRAYWMIEVLDTSSTIGCAWNISISKPEASGLLPCNDTVWAFPEAVFGAWSFNDFGTSSAYSLYVMLVTSEVFHVHRFLQQSFDMQSATERARCQSECQEIDDNLVAWRARFIIAQERINAENCDAYDPNIILTHCALDLATIALYQRLAIPPPELQQTQGPWYHAIQRCLDACNSIATTLRKMSDVHVSNLSPMIIPSIFVASRFFLVHAKLASTPVPAPLHILLYALKTSALRWPYARRLEKVIRTAAADETVPMVMSSLPVQFYDLQYSYIDIDEALRVWVL